VFPGVSEAWDQRLDTGDQTHRDVAVGHRVSGRFGAVWWRGSGPCEMPPRGARTRRTGRDAPRIDRSTFFQKPAAMRSIDRNGAHGAGSPSADPRRCAVHGCRPCSGHKRGSGEAPRIVADSLDHAVVDGLGHRGGLRKDRGSRAGGISGKGPLRTCAGLPGWPAPGRQGFRRIHRPADGAGPTG
jgi:hypothetical protein